MPAAPWFMRGLRLAGLLSATARAYSTAASLASHHVKRTTVMASRGALVGRPRFVRRRPGFVASLWSVLPTISTTRPSICRQARRGRGSSVVSSTTQRVTTAQAMLQQQRHHIHALADGSQSMFSSVTVVDLERRSLSSRGRSRLSGQGLWASSVASAGAGTFSSHHATVLEPPPLASARRAGRGVSMAAAAATGAVAEDGGVVGLDGGGDDGDGAGSFKVNLLDMRAEEVDVFMKSIGEPKYRAGQVLKWMYEGGALSFDDMTNLPKALRAKLSKVATVGALEVAAQQTSKDGTRKRAYRLSDGQLIESVLMPYADGRRTACISSQAGCAMGCVFCATGQMGFKRQLTSSEIFEQAYRFAQELAAKGERLSNVVFMGMGEPLANYNTVMDAVRRINTELGIGARHITISTVGLVPRILRLAQENIQVKLAVSLHAANDRERSALLPVNRRFPLGDLMDACKEYVDATGRRMTFEWALIQGENDSAEVAAELGRLLRPLKGMCHVNIIPLNPTAGYAGGPSMADAVEEFISVLDRFGVPATPRVRRGIDIDAGCGQLTVRVANRDEVFGKGL